MAEEKSELGNQNMICRSLANVSKYHQIVYLNRKTNAFFSLDLYYCYKSFSIVKGKTEELCFNLNRRIIQKREATIVFLGYIIFLYSPSY